MEFKPILFSLGLLSITALASPPLTELSGGGITLRVLTRSDDGVDVSGQWLRDGEIYPYSGTVSNQGNVETITGSYMIDQQDFDFTTKQAKGADIVLLETEGKVYQLKSSATSASASAPAASSAKPQPAPSAARAMKFRTAEFTDINMGNVVAYTMLVPEGWQAEGHIEWSQDQTPYPQRKIKVTGPDGSRIAWFPAMAFGYSQASPLALREAAASGLPSVIPAQSGTPRPRNLGAWLVEFLTLTNKEISQLTLVSDERDSAMEAALRKANAASGHTAPGSMEIHRITLQFLSEGVAMTEELNLTMSWNPPIVSRNMTFGNWMLFTNSSVRAPAATFARQKPLLYAAASSLRNVPQWWNQQQLLIMETTRNNHRIGMAEIAARGAQYSRLSDARHAEWKQQQRVSDSQQNDRINTINEVSDFRGSNGINVKLPIHYKHYYSDGQGNYMMSNGPAEPPGEGWSKLEPLK